MSIFTTAGCRVRQVFLRLGRRMRPIREQTVEQCPGAVFSAAQLLRANRLKKPLVVIGPEAAPWRERLLRSLEESDIDYAIWDQLSVPPTVDNGENIRLFWLGERCDSFIALGHAETIDAAKAAAARTARRGKTIPELSGAGRVRRGTPPVMAIPTSAGSGAEASGLAVVADGRGGHFLLEDAALVPAFAVLDAELSENVPRPVVAEAVMRGMCLAVEAYVSGFSDEESRLWASQAAEGFFAAAEACWNDGGTTEQRERLLAASRLAGLAATRAGRGYAGVLSAAVQDVAGIAFGDACAVLLPLVMEKYGNSAAERLSELSARAGVSPEGTRAEKTAALISRIRGLAFRIGLPDTLEGVSEEQAVQIAAMVASRANPYCACPAVWTAARCAALLHEAIKI